MFTSGLWPGTSDYGTQICCVGGCPGPGWDFVRSSARKNIARNKNILELTQKKQELTQKKQELTQKNRN